MAFSRAKAFEIPSAGLAIEGGPLILGGSSDPSLDTTDGPTLFLQDNGDLWSSPGGSTWTKANAASDFFSFPYFHIVENKFVRIESGQNMATTHLVLDGCLTLDGCLEIK